MLNLDSRPEVNPIPETVANRNVYLPRWARVPASILVLTGLGAVDQMTSFVPTVEGANNKAECIDKKGSKTGTFQSVGKQVWFFNLEGRENIFDKGTQEKPLDPWLEKPALGGYMQIFPPEKKQADKIDPKVEPVGSSLFSTTEPKIPNVKLTDSGRNIAWAYAKWDAPYNSTITLKDGRVLCAYTGWIASTQHPENLVPYQIPGEGSVNPYWFGREMKNGEDFIREASSGIGRDMPPSVETIREAYKRFLESQKPGPVNPPAPGAPQRADGILETGFMVADLPARGLDQITESDIAGFPRFGFDALGWLAAALLLLDRPRTRLQAARVNRPRTRMWNTGVWPVRETRYRLGPLRTHNQGLANGTIPVGTPAPARTYPRPWAI